MRIVAAQVPSAATVERDLRDQLRQQTDPPVSPFDSSSFAHLLKLAAGGWDSEGPYRPVVATNDPSQACNGRD